MKISFRVVETSQKGQSLLQWYDDDGLPERRTIGNLHSLQMPSEVAQYVMESCNARPVVKKLLKDAEEALIDNPCHTRETIQAFLKSFWRD